MTETKEVVKVTQIEEIRGSLTKMSPQFAMALPKNISAERFVRVLMTALQNNPDLVSANRASLYSSAMKCAQDGLLADGREAALVILGGEVVYMPMVIGILKKVRNSGELASITSHVIYKNDAFEFWIDGTGEHIKHNPLMFGERGTAIGVYALAITKDGSLYVEVLDTAQVMAVKSVAKTKYIWDGAFGTEMWRKTAIRRLSKRLPMSTDKEGDRQLQQVIERDDEMYDFEIKAEVPKGIGKPSRLKAALSETVEPIEAESEEI